MFGYAADGCANLIVSDTSYSGTWRLLHAVSNAGGSRFTVGSAVRYPPGRSDAANKARLYQFEALRKIYFYDAWRSEPILNRDNSPLLLPPAPGMLQDGCYWTTAAAVVDTQSPDASMPANSLPPDDPDLISSDEQPSLLPSPDSICSLPNSQAPPASGSNQACEEGSPTQASESAAPSAGTVTSSGGEEGTPVHEISSCDSPKPVHEGGEDREEEAATDDSVVEQQEEKEATSIWEVNDSSSESFHSEPVDRGHSFSATSPPSASPCAHTDEQQAAPPPEDTGAARVPTESVDSTAGPSGLSRHRTDLYDVDKVTEGDCPSSYPSVERTEAGTGTPHAQVLKGMRRRWQQASLARAAEPTDRGDPIDADASQQPTAEDKQVAATSTDRGKVTLLTAASKHSAVKSKAAKPLTVLQCIAENVESTPVLGREDASQQSVLCGHTGLASLAETPV